MSRRDVKEIAKKKKKRNGNRRKMKRQSIELVVLQKEFVGMIFIVVSLFLIFSVFRLMPSRKIYYTFNNRYTSSVT